MVNYLNEAADNVKKMDTTGTGKATKTIIAETFYMGNWFQVHFKTHAYQKPYKSQLF